MFAAFVTVGELAKWRAAHRQGAGARNRWRQHVGYWPMTRLSRTTGVNCRQWAKHLLSDVRGDILNAELVEALEHDEVQGFSRDAGDSSIGADHQIDGDIRAGCR